MDGGRARVGAGTGGNGSVETAHVAMGTWRWHAWEWEWVGMGTRGAARWVRGTVGAPTVGFLCPTGMLLWVRSSRGAGAVSALGVPMPWDGDGGTVWSPWDVWLLGTQFGVSRCALECCSVGCLWGHPAPWGRSGDTWPLGDTLRGAWEIDCGVMLSWMQWGHAALRGHAGDICVSGEAL